MAQTQMGDKPPIEAIEEEIQENPKKGLPTNLKLSSPYIRYERLIVDSIRCGKTEFFIPTESEKFDLLVIMDPENPDRIIDFILPMSAFGRNVGQLEIVKVGDQAEYVKIVKEDESNYINRYLYIAGGYGKEVSGGGNACIEEIGRVSSAVIRMYSWYKKGAGSNEDDEDDLIYVEIVSREKT